MSDIEWRGHRLEQYQGNGMHRGNNTFWRVNGEGWSAWTCEQTPPGFRATFELSSQTLDSGGVSGTAHADTAQAALDAAMHAAADELMEIQAEFDRMQRVVQGVW